MATVSAVVLKHHEMKDGTFNVKIRVNHKNERKYIETGHYVSRRQMDGKLKIIDSYVLRELEETLGPFRKMIAGLRGKLDFMTVGEVRDHLRQGEKEINFIAFCDRHISKLKKAGRTGTANNHRAVRNSLADYFHRDKVAVTEITANMLFAYEEYLQTERAMVRINQLGKEVKTVKKGMRKAGIYNHMRDLRTLFNAACLVYNDEDLGDIRIKHYPFRKYKVGSPPLTRKRNITIEQVKIIRDCKPDAGSRAELARDLFLLSFFLCGINAADLFQLPEIPAELERIEYNRAKTRSVRKDEAFISIRIPEEARPLLKKHAGKLQLQYAACDGLNWALHQGMEKLRELTGIEEITLYWARHTFATLARNKCRMSKDDVAMALNHVDAGHKTTDIYLDKDWTIIDEVQEAVLGLLSEQDVPKVTTLAPTEQRRTMFVVSA